MSKFFYKSGVKIAVAILCILNLTVAVLSGVCVAGMLSTGEYDGSGSIQEAMMESQLENDHWDIMNNYFDPNEPERPWESYYSGGIYTGEGSNFRYNVVDKETGYSVLATVTGGEKILMRREYDHGYELGMEMPVEDRYLISDSVFSCGGTIYCHDEDADYFYPVYDENVAEHLSAKSVGDDIFQLGFTYVALDKPAEETEKVAESSTVAPIMQNEFHYDYDGEGFFRSAQATEYVPEWKEYTIICYVLSDLRAQDNYLHIYNLSRFLAENRYYLIGIFTFTAVVGIILLVLLGCSLGRDKDREAPVVSLIYKLPTEIFLIAAFFGLIFGMEITYSMKRMPHFWFSFAGEVLILLALVALVVYTVCFLCVRYKTHTLLSGSVVGWLWRNMGRISKKLAALLGRGIRYLPLVWKVAACYGMICLLEFVVLIAFTYSFDDVLGFLWFAERLLLGAGVLYVALAFRRLKNGAEAIAAGDYTTKIPEEHLVLDFADTADTLNHIRDGMNAAVDSRMKSERLKTELITNVSHDIKTPLTSIVSYVDLLKKEPMGSDNAREYVAVLERQSARLKKLVEDLVEASKASTGNITVNAENMDLSVVLGQALGEYNERLLEAELIPVVKLPEMPVTVFADGRLLWRIFDNLLGNAVKYAMPGTRLYVSLTADTHAIVTIRNISREPLDVSADELMERFVRGDASRHTEGSGLGLSIAKSLTESMGGEFLLSLDGDLFKAAVILPLLPE